ISWESLLLNAALAPLVVLGALAGRRLATRMNQQLFEKLVIGLTLVSAVNLLL
ncbi:MAG: sulfite exporter TauE/SafE family protein, partial [Actinomycetales bacterium]|nr:sulfite exporter TauE/SafE family protein [Actinomycetales bacterium]